MNLQRRLAIQYWGKNMNIGSIIKTKRQAKDLTQEQLAEYLNISVSAVSQWESGKTTPDFSMLIPLAEFFDITLDELLGRMPGEKEKVINEYNEKHIAIANKGDMDAGIALWREALARYPGDFNCMDNLAYFLLNKIYVNDQDRTVSQNAKECVSLCESIVRDCKDSDIRDSAIQKLVYLYSTKTLSFADEKKAVEYAMMASSRYCCRERLLEHAYFTKESKKEQIELKHQNRLADMDELVNSLMWEPDVSIEEYLQALETSLKLWETLIYDGNYLFFHCRIADIYEAIAGIHAKKQSKKETLYALEKAFFHANAYDTRPEGKQHFTSIFVRAATDDKSKASTNSTKTMLERTREFAGSLVFLQNDPDYLALIKRYETK